MEKRLIDLEIRLAFQEHTLEALNHVVVKQQQEITQLRAEIVALKQQMRVHAAANIAHPSEETLPPHY